MAASIVSADLDALLAVANERLKYPRGERSILAGEANSAWQNRVTPDVLITLIERVKVAERNLATYRESAWAAEARVKVLENDVTLANLYDEAQDEITDLRANIAALRAGIRALADERDGQGFSPQRTAEIRALLTKDSE